MYQEIKNNSNHQININENKETIINTQNSDMRVLDNSIYYKNKVWISGSRLKRLTGMMIEPHHHIAAINSENKIKVDDPLVATCHGKNTYVWFLTREACIYIVNKIRSSSLPFDKTTVKKNLNSFFDNVESSLKTPYRALIDISYGVNGNNKLNLYADCSDMMLALKRIYESEKVRESLNGEENITINISIDKTTAIRQKI